MKYALFAILFMLCVSSGFAQLEKGNFRVGGTIGFSSVQLNTPSQASETAQILAFNPSVSYFIVKQFSVGLILPWSIQKTSGSGVISHDVSYLVGPVIRYYLPFGSWAVFPELSYSFGKDKFSSGSSMSTTNRSSFRAGLGLTYFLNRNVGLEGILGYQDDSRQSQPEQTIKTVSFKIGLQIYLHKNLK